MQRPKSYSFAAALVAVSLTVLTFQAFIPFLLKVTGITQ